MSIQSDCRTLAEEILKDDLRQLKDCISTHGYLVSSLRAERDAARADLARKQKAIDEALAAETFLRRTTILRPHATPSQPERAKEPADAR